MEQDKDFLYKLLANNYNLSMEEISNAIKFKEELEALKEIKAIKDKLMNNDYNLSSEEISIIAKDDNLTKIIYYKNPDFALRNEELLMRGINDEVLSDIIINTYMSSSSEEEYPDFFFDHINYILAKKIAVIPENFNQEERETKIKEVEEHINYFEKEHFQPMIFHLYDQSYVDIMNLDEKNFKKLANILDNIEEFNLNDFNGAVMSLNQLVFPKKEKNRHIVRLFNEIVDTHKKSISSNNMEENKVLYNNLLSFLELGIDKSILDVINDDEKLLLEFKSRGYLEDEKEEIDAPKLIEIIKKDIEDTKGENKYNFLHKITDLYIEKERRNYINNGYFEEITFWSPLDENIYEDFKKDNLQEVIRDLVNANSYVETDEDVVDEIVHNDKKSIDKIRELNSLFKKNCEKFRTIKAAECKREKEYQLPYYFNNSSLKTVLQNDILTTLYAYTIRVDDEKIALQDYLVNKIVEEDNKNTLGDNKKENASRLLNLYIEKLKGLDYDEKRDYEKCIGKIATIIDNKELALLVDGKEYDQEINREQEYLIRNIEKKKKNYLANAEKEIKGILVNDIINNCDKYSVNDLSLKEYLVENISNVLKNEVSSEDLRRKILINIDSYGKDDKRLDLVDKKINKIIKEEVNRLYDDKNSLYLEDAKYNSEKHKEALGIKSYLEKLRLKKEKESLDQIKEIKILDIFNNMSKYEVQNGDKKVSLYDYLVDKVKKDQTTEEFEEELDKIIRIKKEFENKELIKTLNSVFDTLIPLDKKYINENLLYYDEVYDSKEHRRNIDEAILERTKEYYINDVQTKISIYQIISSMNIDELKENLLEDEETYNSFIKLLKSKKFLKIPFMLEERLESNNYRNTPESMATFITHYNKILEREKKIAKNKGTIFTENSLSIPKIIDLGNIEAALDSKYSALLGVEDALYIYKDPERNSSYTDDKEERFALGVYYLLNNYKRQYVTVPPFDEDVTIEDGFDKKMNVVVGNFSNSVNLTHGERTDACMRINGAAKTLFNFCLLNENGFHITFEDPETHEYISRASGFRNGNTVVINGLRESYNEKYDNDELIKVMFKVAQMLVERTKDDEYPIQNVFVGKDESFKSKYQFTEEFYDVQSIEKGFSHFYLDAENGGIVLATSKAPSEEQKFVPIELGPEKATRYDVQRGRLREYTDNEEVANEFSIIKTSNFDKAIEKIMMIDSAKKLLEQGKIPLGLDDVFEHDKVKRDLINTVKEEVEKLEISKVDYEIKYAAVGDDFYIVLDKDNNIHSNYLDIPNDKAKIERNSMIDRVKKICSSIVEKEVKTKQK